MKYLVFLLPILVFTACSSKNVRFNGLICPAEFSQERVHKDITACHYYDEKAAAEASKSPIKPDCVECLEKKGYKLEQ
jgi:hypothetical protein